MEGFRSQLEKMGMESSVRPGKSAFQLKVRQGSVLKFFETVPVRSDKNLTIDELERLRLVETHDARGRWKCQRLANA